MNKDIWWYKDDDQWIKLKYRGDISSLEDMFEFMEDIPNKHIKKGNIVSMYYGSAKTLRERGELLTDEEYRIIG